MAFDPEYGAQEGPDLGDAFWLVASPANSALAQRAWRAGTTDPNSAIFRAGDLPPADEQITDRLDDVALHHPDWKEIEVIGAPLTRALGDRLITSGLEASATALGFKLRRSTVRLRDDGHDPKWTDR